MHLDASLGFVVAHHMLETREIKISRELAVDSREQILVERGRHSGGIVVSQFQHVHRLLKISREQQCIAFVQDRSHLAEKLISGRAVEITNRTAEKQKEDLFAFTPACRYLLQAIQICALE